MKRVWILPLFFVIMGAAVFASADEKVSYDAHGKRDPFVPLVSETSVPVPMEEAAMLTNMDEIKIEGIVYDPNQGSIVMLNGNMLREGEALGGIKVLKIQPDGVSLLFNDQEIFKEMHSEEEPS